MALFLRRLWIARRRIALAAAGVCWLVAVVGGLVWVARYDNKPGLPAAPPNRWPQASRLAADASGPTLVMFGHPLCDCTKASLTELSELLAASSPRPRAYVVFVVTEGLANQWDQATTPAIAQAIPGVSIIRDAGGVEARRFGARTSGQVMLFGADGRLQFSGGTTRARGHLGSNVGVTSILALLNHATPEQRQTPVFGCALFGPTDEPGSTP